MRRTELVTLNMRELDRLKMIQAIAEMGLKPGRAAERLGLSVRQAQRDERRASGSPSRTNRGLAVERDQRKPGTKKQREFTKADLNEAIVQIAQQPKTCSIPGLRSAKTR